MEQLVARRAHNPKVAAFKSCPRYYKKKDLALLSLFFIQTFIFYFVFQAESLELFPYEFHLPLKRGIYNHLLQLLFLQQE